MQTQQQSKDSLNTTSSSPQSLWQKLNSPEYTKIVGKRIFCCSLLIIFISFALALLIRNDQISDFLVEISVCFLFFGLPIGGLLWIGKFDNSCCNNNLRDSDISISGSHRITNIHNINNPANPLSYHHRNR